MVLVSVNSDNSMITSGQLSFLHGRLAGEKHPSLKKLKRLIQIQLIQLPCELPLGTSMQMAAICQNSRKMNGFCVGKFYVNLKQARLTGEKGASREKMPPKDRAVDKPVGHFLYK